VFRFTIRDLLWLMVVVAVTLTLGLALLAQYRIAEEYRNKLRQLEGPCDSARQFQFRTPSGRATANT
jgi:hypothetical protein